MPSVELFRVVDLMLKDLSDITKRIHISKPIVPQQLIVGKFLTPADSRWRRISLRNIGRRYQPFLLKTRLTFSILEPELFILPSGLYF